MGYAENIARAYGGEWHGSYGTMPAPGHGRADRGVTVKDADTGDDVVFHSFNGADWRALKDECRARGLLPERPRANDNRPRDVAAWDYTDADGVVIYRKVRMARSDGGKSYRFEHPDGRGGWAPKRGDARPAPYRLHELAHAPQDVILYMAEGEKQADKLASWGLLATSSKDWRGFDFAGYVNRRTVVILPDNDAEGAAVAERARVDVERAGGRAVFVELSGLPPKGDIMDWTGDADELRRLTFAVLNPPVDTIALLDPAAWAGAVTPARTWALYEMILVGQVTYLTGAGATGKSLLGQQLATCIATGRPFLGLDVRQGVALYLTCEDDADELHRRQKAICDALRIPIASLSGKLHLASLAGAIGNELATFDPAGRMAATAAYDRLRATVVATGATFVVLDNVAHLFAGNENIRNQVAAFLSLLNGLAGETGAAVLLIGHPNKAGDSYSGSTAWENQVRSRLFLERPKEADGTVVDPDARVLSRGKTNYSRNGEGVAFRWHQWAFVRDEDLPPNVAAELGAVIRGNAENEAFLRFLDKATDERRATSPSGSASNYAPRVFAKMTGGAAIGEAGFAAALERLLHLGTIRNGERVYQRDNRQWVTGIGRVDGCTNPCTNPAQTGRTDPHEAAPTPCTDPLALTPLDTTYLSGAAHGSAAPFREEPERQLPDRSRTAFPADGPDELDRLREQLNPTDPFAPGDDDD